MKKLYLVLAIMILAGCSPDSSDELLKLRQPASEFARKWVETYGESPKSIQAYNMAVTQQMLRSQMKDFAALMNRIEKLEKRVGEVENISIIKGMVEQEVLWPVDPNGVK